VEIGREKGPGNKKRGREEGWEKRERGLSLAIYVKIHPKLGKSEGEQVPASFW